jgi:hypothetical protein
VTPEQIRRVLFDMPTETRRALVSQIASDLALDERVTTQSDWLSFRLRAALAKRGARSR